MLDRAVMGLLAVACTIVIVGGILWIGDRLKIDKLPFTDAYSQKK